MAIKLNVAAHDIHLQDFINLDNDPNMAPDRLLDCTKLTEYYERDSVDFIYCGHFLEHIKYRESLDVVRSFHAILKPYACCVAVIPDYAKAPAGAESAERIILGDFDHKCLYDSPRLLKTFREAGFTAWSVDVRDLPWCRFPEVIWQSAVIGIKHPRVEFK